jgi:predicted ribosome quality control (RQC) complex YloA/Tae2 family protein
MVHFFKTSTGHILYMGADKYENENLIRFGLPEDIWFHVDDMSSAHVYLRLQKKERLDEVPFIVIEECAQLVKSNSIEGCKLKAVTVSEYFSLLEYDYYSCQ